MDDKPIAAGKSSYDMVDQNAVVQALALSPGDLLLDVAGGAGNYAIDIASSRPDVKVVAVDLWAEGIAELVRRASAGGLKNVQAEVADVSRHIPLEDRTADVCLIATALHDLAADNAAEGSLREIARVLKAGGRLVIIEFKKVEGPPGPPRHIRLSPEELDELVLSQPFEKENSRDAGEYTYLTVYSRTA
jgi:ubiquinone/menaquinone biosynthesis C-methylase UbiE